MKVKSPNRISSMFTFFIVLLPCLSIYAIPGLNLPVSLGEATIIVLILLILLDMAAEKRSKVIATPFSIYLIYAFVSTVFVSALFLLLYQSYSISDMISRVVRDCLYMSLIVFFGKDYFDYQKAKKFIEIVATLLSLYVFAQFFLYQVFDFYLSGFIPSVKTTISGGAISDEISAHFLKNATIDGFVKAHGFLSEPAAAAHFLSTALLLELIPLGRKINFKRAILYSAGMVFTFSVNAYIALVFCWLVWMVVYARRGKEIIHGIVFICVVLLFVIPTAINSDFVGAVVGRLTGLFSGESTQNSAAMRVFRGWAFYFEMPFIYQLIGSGFGNFIEFKEALSISTVYEQADEYLNSNSYIAISSGIIGLFLYVMGIWREASQKHPVAKCMALLLFLFGFSSSIYSSGMFVIMMLLIFNCPRKENV